MSYNSVCRSWYSVCYDPYLYCHIEFDNMEYKTLVASLQRISIISPKIQSITIKNCYSEFIQNTVVPVHFSQRAHNTGPMLFSHITALQPPRRRDEYMKHQFELHDKFSDAMNLIFKSTQDSLRSITISGCTLDLEMTDLFPALACFCRSLETFVYINNHDKGIHSSGLLQAIVLGCPNMKHFIGLHSGMEDAVLINIARHWKSLESLTMCSLKNREILGHAEIVSEGFQLTGASPTGRISYNAFWRLLNECRSLASLELYDLSCISNRDLANYENSLNHQDQPIASKRYQPYHIPTKKSSSGRRAGSSIRHLMITKYMTTPLSKPGFESLLRLFPNLERLEYKTNFHTFDNLFEGITKDVFDAERKAVRDWFQQEKSHLTYVDGWDAKITAEQRLMAGMASVSEIS